MDNGRVSHYVSRWTIWQQWTLVSMGGAGVAAVLYAMLPHGVTYPGMIYDEYAYAADPWRYLIVYGIMYSVISGAQSLLLRQYVADAWRWVVVTVASAAVLFPGIMWLCNTLGGTGIAELVWSAGIDYQVGFGGHLFAIVGQSFILERWTPAAWLWFVFAPFLGGCALISAIVVSAPLERLVGSSDIAFVFLAWTIFYAISGLIMAMLLTNNRRAQDLPR